MSVLVTGVSGFSGNVVARRLAAAGHDVIGLHRSSPPAIEALRTVPGVRLHQGDLADIASLPRARVIVHVAATSPMPGVDAKRIASDNVGGVIALLDAAERWGTERFIFFSSLSLHGRITQPVVNEATPVIDPDAYGASKLLGEQMLRERASALPSLSIRLPGVIGPGAARNWMSGVAARLKRGDGVPAFNVDAPFNNAVDVAEIADLVVSALARPMAGADAVTVGAAGMTTVGGAIHAVARGLGVRARIDERPAPQPGFTLDSSHAIAAWGYAPSDIGVMLERYGRAVAAGG